MTTAEQEQLRTEATIDLDLAGDEECHVREQAIAVWVPVVKRYYVLQLDGKRWWTNDLTIIDVGFTPPPVAVEE